jgi:hypothetical protein
MGWVFDGSAGRLEYYDRRGARVHEFSVAAIAGVHGVLDLLFSAAESSKLTDEDVGRPGAPARRAPPRREEARRVAVTRALLPQRRARSTAFVDLPQLPSRVTWHRA